MTNTATLAWYCDRCAAFVEPATMEDIEEFWGAPVAREYYVDRCSICDRDGLDERTRCVVCTDRPAADGYDTCTHCESVQSETDRLAETLLDIARSPLDVGDYHDHLFDRARDAELEAT